jgi:ABC-type uncharacterized transport system substrate-binding protein
MADQLRAMQRFRQVTKLGVIYNASEPNSTLAVTRLRGLAAQFAVQLGVYPPLDLIKIAELL